jgi:hypothetical protein
MLLLLLVALLLLLPSSEHLSSSNGEQSLWRAGTRSLLYIRPLLRPLLP